MPLGPRLVWTLARIAVWVFYRVDRVGQPLPDGPVLVVANHPNGLLDPPMIVATAGRTPRFLAKSTLFSMPLVGWFVRGAGAIPVYRRNDPGVDPARNAEMFADVERALAAGAAVCLFPEGTTHSRGRLEPLKTGAARIALGAAARGIDLRIVAVGLNFDRKAILRSDATVAYGPAFTCGHLVDLSREDEASAVARLTRDIARHIADLTIEAEHVDEAELVARIDRIYVAARGVADAPAARLARRQRLAEHLLPALRASRPADFEDLVETVRRYDRRLTRFGLREDMVGGEVPLAAAVRFGLRETAWLIVLAPILAAGVVVFALPYHLVKWLTTRGLRISLEEQATYKVFGGLVVHGAWVVSIAAAVWWWIGPVAAAATAALLPLLAFATLFAWEREAAVFDTVRSYFAWQRLSPRAARALAAQRQAIADTLDRLAEC